MAKKVVVPEGSTENGGTRVKRKRSVCCSCCIAILIVYIVILAAAFAVGWILGDKFLKAYFDMSMSDTVGVVNGLYYANDKKVVKNPYSDDDLDKFYGQIKSNILLKEDAEVDFDKALKDAISSMSNGKESDSKDAGKKVPARNADGSSAVSSISGVFGDMLSGVFTRENIDTVKLSEYSEEHDEYIFDLQDKGLAAFIDAVLGALLDSGIVNTKDMVGVDMEISKHVRIKQITFKAEATTNDLGENVISATTADITVWLGLQGLAGEALTGFVEKAGYGWAGFAARGLGNMILPKNFYATVTIPFSGDSEPQFTLNSMNEKKRKNTYKLVNGIMGLTGNDMTVEGFMTDTMSKMKPMLESIAQKADLTSAAQGTIKFDLIQTLTDVLNSSLDTEEKITKADFMYLLKAILASDPDKRLEELQNYLYKGWYRPENDDEAKPVFNPADKTGKKEVDYEKEFAREIERKYCIDLGDKSLKEVLDMLGLSMNSGNTSAGSSDLLKQINTVRFHEALKVSDDNISSLNLEITDRMLAAAFDGQMDSLLGTGGFGGMSVGLDAITFVSSRPGGTLTDRQYALLAVQIDISNFFGGSGDSMLGKLASGILPDKLIISIYSDVTTSIPLADRDKVTYEFNDFAETERIVDTLSKIMPSLDLSSICQSVDDMLYSMIDQLNKKLNITLVPSNEKDGADFTSAELQMPNIFKLVSRMVLVDEQGKPIVTDAQFKNVVNGLEDTTGVNKTANVAQSYNGFLNDVTDKYYLNPAQPLKSFDDLTNFVTGGMDTTKFRFKAGSAAGLDPLVYDKRTPDKLKPAMSGAEIGALIADKLQGNSDGINEQFKILSVKVVEDGKLNITLAIDISTILPDNMHNLITADKLYITAAFDTKTVLNEGTEDAAYKVDLTVNSMTDHTQEDALKIVTKLSNGSTDIDGQVKSFGKLFYQTLNDLSKQMDSEGKLGEVFKFEEEKDVGDTHVGGLVLVDFYSFLGSKLGINMNPKTEGSTSPTLVQKAIQGMYARETVYNNPNNYVVDTINYGTPENILINNPEGTTDITDATVTAVDKAFNGTFSVVGAASGGDSGVTAKQTVILKSGDNRVKTDAVRTWLSGKVSPIDPVNNSQAGAVDSSNSYMMITFELRMDKFLGSSDENAKSFLPDYMYATVVYKQQGSGFAPLGIVFNNMDAQTYSVMFSLMKLDINNIDTDTVNIVTIDQQCGEILNGLNNVTLSETGTADCSDGYGNISYTL